ncbi:transcriptional activator of glycolytic enzymes-domain-containing protein [Pilaira anomala]|nr:transcriptional activator of glycolytic enzymes-domain-containing protein [Pilaira anomala]
MVSIQRSRSPIVGATATTVDEIQQETIVGDNSSSDVLNEEVLSRYTFSLSKDITTVQGLWEEWYTTGSPSTNNKPVVELNRLHGSKWRTSQKECAFYSRRLAIINEISKRQEEDSVTTEGAIKLCSEQKYSLGLSLIDTYCFNFRQTSSFSR